MKSSLQDIDEQEEKRIARHYSEPRESASDMAQREPPPRPRVSGCLIFILALLAFFAITTGIVVIGGGDRMVQALRVLRGEPLKATVHVSAGDVIPVLKLVVQDLHATVHVKRTGPVLGGAAQSLPRHLIAQGTITACFDLQDPASGFQLEPDPLDPQHVTVRLPAPEYCSASIENAEYFDEAGIGVAATNDINGPLLEDARQQLYVAADKQDLLARARERGALQVKELLYQLGFTRVDVIFAPPAPVQ